MARLNQHLRPAASATTQLLGRKIGVFRRAVVFITKHFAHLEPIGLVQSGWAWIHGSVETKISQREGKKKMGAPYFQDNSRSGMDEVFITLLSARQNKKMASISLTRSEPSIDGCMLSGIKTV